MRRSGRRRGAVVLARALCLLAASVTLAGCETVARSYDRMFGSGPTQKPAALIEIKPTAVMRIQWQGSVGASEKSVFFPARSGNTVYAAGAAGGVAGFDVAGGGEISRFEAGQRIAGGVGAGSGLVLLGTGKGEVLAFESSGKPLWKAQLSGEVLAPPQILDGIVVARAGQGRIYGLDAATGRQRWTYQRATPALSVRAHTGLVVQRGAVFAGFPGGRLVALTLADGKVGWDAVVALPRGATELERVADVASLPVVDGPRVCAAAFQGRVACVDTVRGALIWARDISSLAGVGVDRSYLYLTDDRNAVVALDKSTGASIWRQDKLSGRNVTGPLAIGRHVAVGDIEGYVHLLSREDGAFAARIATDGSAISAAPMALDSSTFLVQTRNGGVYAITIQ